MSSLIVSIAKEMDIPPAQKADMLLGEQQAELYKAREIENGIASSHQPSLGGKTAVPAIAYGRRCVLISEEDESVTLNYISDCFREDIKNDFICEVHSMIHKWFPSYVPDRRSMTFSVMIHYLRYFAENLDKQNLPGGLTWDDEEKCWFMLGDRIKPIDNSQKPGVPEIFEARVEEQMKRAEEIFGEDEEELKRFRKLLRQTHVGCRGEVKLAMLEIACYSTEADEMDTKMKRAQACGWFQCNSFFFANYDITAQFLNISVRWLGNELRLWHGYGQKTDFEGWSKYYDYPRI